MSDESWIANPCRYMIKAVMRTQRMESSNLPESRAIILNHTTHRNGIEKSR